MTQLDEIASAVSDLESDRVERKRSLGDPDRILQAICAFANDLAGNKAPGYVFVGVDDTGNVVDLEITDRLLLTLSDMRDSGRILPLPHMEVQVVHISNKPIVMVRVHPSDAPPVRLEGQVWIRVGPRRAVASAEEERRLTERNVFGTRTFDRRPCVTTTINDLIFDIFKNEYLPSVVSRDVISENHREIREQLASLRLFDLRAQTPTNAGVLLIGNDPLDVLPGAYVQFVRFDGYDLEDAILDHKMIAGNLMTQLRQLEELLPIQLKTPVGSGSGLRHKEGPDYPIAALRELVFNAIMHRSYEATNSPVRINWFHDRVEIQNPGGLFGHVTPDNYRRTSDYRNPVIAEAMKSLGYVERFGVGISRAVKAMSANGNPAPEFTFEPTHVSALMRANR